MTPDPALAARLRALARPPGPLLAAIDLDGTLAPIAPTPEEARVPPETLAALSRLAARARVAIVTGRDLAAARALAPVAGLEFAASHGLETSWPSAPAPDRSAELDALAHAVAARIASPALRVERKARSAAFHHRADPALAEPLRAALAELLPAGLRLQPGRLVLEALPDGGGKDAALLTLAGRVRPRAALALGDDRTDAPMFRALGELRAKGARTLALGVAGGAETPPEVVAACDALVEQTDVTALLALLADALG